MTKEERDLLMPVVREIMGKSNRNITDDDVQKAMEQLGMIAEESAMSAYFYEHPDYGQMVGEVPDILRPLLNTGEDTEGMPSVDDFMTSCSQMDRSTLATAVNSIIYFWLDQWHDDSLDDIWTHPVHVAIMLAERFTLRECMPALLELERQDRDFAEMFFDMPDVVGMVPACIYNIATVDDLPLLADFMREIGIHTFVKAEVAAAVSTLPRRAPKTLPMVQQWLCDLLAVFADNIDSTVGDVMLLEAIIHCCIHTRCEVAKAMIIRMYSKYKLPDILIPGGVNEVRRTIKKADIGVLKEELECAETIWQNAQTSWDDEDYDDDDDEYYEDDEEDYEDEEDDDFDDEGLAPCQEYCGYAYGGAYHYMPVKKLKKYTLRIELKDSKPLVWRELEVPSSLCLSSLATAILLAMGWDEDHLHQFTGKDGSCYSTSVNDPGDSLFSRSKDGSRYGISHLLQKQGDSTLFEYDFGDSWRHTVKLKEVSEYADDEPRAVKLTDGANACPPDDCGGIHRYRYLLELMQNKPRSRELTEFYEWMGCKWDPEYFPMKVAAIAVDRKNK